MDRAVWPKFELLFQFGESMMCGAKLEEFRDALTMDLYLRENAKHARILPEIKRRLRQQ